MTEWWQEGEDDVAVPVPRRDSVPEAYFSDPKEVTSSPELVTFIPKWRARRRAVAIVVTVAGLGLIVWSLIDVSRIMAIADPVESANEMGRFIGDCVQVAVALVAIILMWHRANRKDPRDQRKVRS